MTARLSPRLAAIVDALPVEPHSRVLEIGCGPGAAARAVAAKLTTGHVLAIDRSAAAVRQAVAAARGESRVGANRLSGDRARRVRRPAVPPAGLRPVPPGRPRPVPR